MIYCLYYLGGLALENDSKIQKFFSKTIMIIVAIITFLIGFFAIGKTVFFNLVINFASEQCFTKSDNILLNILLVILVLGIFYFLYKKILPKMNIKVLFVLMVTFSLSVGLLWINYLKLKPISDQYMVFYCADKLIEKDFTTILDAR